jgi:Polyketide cyclase / dehydrase and lipid transport
VEAPRDDVFHAIWDSDRWPSWWRGVESVVTLEEGDDEGVGSLGRYVWKSRLPYRLGFDTRITRVERPHLMEGEATGELAGTGRWRIYEEDGLSAAVYEWNVHTTAPWMNVLAPLARPVFAWNHDVVMRWGAQGLARLLGARLVASG